MMQLVRRFFMYNNLFSLFLSLFETLHYLYSILKQTDIMNKDGKSMYDDIKRLESINDVLLEALQGLTKYIESTGSTITMSTDFRIAKEAIQKTK